MNISDEYRALNKQLHQNNSGWGSSARLRVGGVQKLATEQDVKSILDYGCGKGLMKLQSGLAMDEYDPAISGKEDIPKSHYDMVICTDVMEHVEPEYVDNVLNEINGLFDVCAYLIIYLVPAVHNFPDGSNCHRTVKPAEWWLDKLNTIFGCDITHRSTSTELEIIAIR